MVQSILSAVPVTPATLESFVKMLVSNQAIAIGKDSKVVQQKGGLKSAYISTLIQLRRRLVMRFSAFTLSQLKLSWLPKRFKGLV